MKLKSKKFKNYKENHYLYPPSHIIIIVISSQTPSLTIQLDFAFLYKLSQAYYIFFNENPTK